MPSSHGIPDGDSIMNDTWRFIVFVTLLVALGALLPLAVEAAVQYHPTRGCPLIVAA